MEAPLSSFSETAATAESIVDSDYDSAIGEEDTSAITTESVLILSALEPNLTLHQRSKLTGISPEGIQCYLHHWLQSFKHSIQGIFCDAAWDEIYCWPPTRAGENASQSCSEVMKRDPEVLHPEQILGSAFRFCGENGTWEWNGWTNYNQCLAGLDDSKVSAGADPDLILVNTVRYIFFVGSVLSITCVLISLFVFYYFKSLRSDRITIQVHLMLSLLLRCILLVIITEPFIFHRAMHYRTVGWTCKTVMALQLYATVASVGWMFVQGHFLNYKVTVNVFDREAPLRAYFGIGWGIPLLLMLLWIWIMEANHEAYCWKNYSKSAYIWIIVGPMILALMVNLLFLVNIMRILLTRIPRTSEPSDCLQFRRTVKAAVVLFPLLGVNNLLFMYNPGGEYEAAYMVTNAVVQASQGSVVATLYCFLNDDVREAIRRECRRRSVKRSVLIPTPSIRRVTVATPRGYRKCRGPQGRSASCNAKSQSTYMCEQGGEAARGRYLIQKGPSFSNAHGGTEMLGAERKVRVNSAYLRSQDIQLNGYTSTGVCKGRELRGFMRTTSV